MIVFSSVPHVMATDKLLDSLNRMIAETRKWVLTNSFCDNPAKAVSDSVIAFLLDLLLGPQSKHLYSVLQGNRWLDY